MTTFKNGPADGQTLMLKRTPIYLRVTLKQKAGKIIADALNEIGDTPQDDEELFAYIVTARPVAHVHMNCGRGRGGFFPIVQYTFIEEQPSDEIMRDQAAWEKWVDSHPRPAGL